MSDTGFRTWSIAGLCAAAIMVFAADGALAQGFLSSASTNGKSPLTEQELDEYSDLVFKSEKTPAEVARFQQLQAVLNETPPIAIQDEGERFLTTRELKLPYLEIAPDIGITRLDGYIKYSDSFYSESTTSSIDGTSARVGVDVRYNVPLANDIEVFAGGWSFANIGGSTGLHQEEEEEMRIGLHYGVLNFSVNNYFTAYAGAAFPIHKSYCECFGPVQILLGLYTGARFGQIDLDLDFTNGFGSERVKKTETYVSPLGGIELKARSAKVFGSNFSLSAALGYQYQAGADATVEAEIGGESGEFHFDVERQQHVYGSLRLVKSF